MHNINPKTLIVSANGGTIDYILPDGEVAFSVAVPPGKVLASEYLDLCPDGAQMVPATSGLVLVQPKTRLSIQPHDCCNDTGANPDYQPSSADRMQREMRLMLANMQADQRRLDARMAALAQIERIPDAPAQPPQADPVVE